MAETKILSAADILDVDDRETVVMEIPEWKGSIMLRAMSSNELIKFQRDIKSDGPARDEAIVRSLIVSIVNEKGEPLFDETKIKDLRKKSVPVVVRIQKRILQLNGMDEENQKRLIEDAKNS